jgi:hypothetical protein
MGTSQRDGKSEMIFQIAQIANAKYGKKYKDKRVAH